MMLVSELSAACSCGLSAALHVWVARATARATHTCDSLFPLAECLFLAGLELIDRVLVGEGGDIEVVFRFGDPVAACASRQEGVA